MAAACNSPPPDYRANVGVCLVNSKNEVTLLLDLAVFSGGKQDRKKERKKERKKVKISTAIVSECSDRSRHFDSVSAYQISVWNICVILFQGILL
jgi:hypothetical protein